MTHFEYPSPQKRGSPRRFFSLIVLFSVSIFFLSLRGNPATLLQGVLTPVAVFSQITGQRLKSTDGRTNILLLGLDRRSDPAITGSGLTDTIIVASVSERTKDAALLSLPRDLWSSSAGYKINALYAVGGIDLIRTTLEKMLDVPLPYYTVVDFTTFERAVDLVGGVEIDVPSDFVDNYYPRAGHENDTCGLSLPPEASESSEFAYPCRFEKVFFPQGRQKMDGASALKYVRSRHAGGDDGTDFARARRQQQVLESLARQALSWEVLLNPVKVKEIFDNYRTGVVTNIGFWEIERFAALGKDFDLKKIRTAVLDTDNVLTHPEPSPETNYQWLLVPRAGDFAEVALFVQRLFFGAE